MMKRQRGDAGAHAEQSTPEKNGSEKAQTVGDPSTGH